MPVQEAGVAGFQPTTVYKMYFAENKKQHMIFRILFFFLALSFLRCSEKTVAPLKHIPDSQAREVLAKAIELSGGWKNRMAPDSVFYTKRSILYDPSGSVESDQTQLHKYQLKPSFAASIIWEAEDGQHEVLFKNNRASETVNGQPTGAAEEALKKLVHGAFYVFFMPFNLLDQQATLTFTGTATLPNHTPVHVISAVYPEGDDWEYYFDKKTGSFAANRVRHGDDYALIFNEKFTTSGGLRFHTYRTSYRVDSLMNIQYRRGEFFYENIILK